MLFLPDEPLFFAMLWLLALSVGCGLLLVRPRGASRYLRDAWYHRGSALKRLLFLAVLFLSCFALPFAFVLVLMQFAVGELDWLAGWPTLAPSLRALIMLALTLPPWIGLFVFSLSMVRIPRLRADDP